jgi:hypothetical protein
MTIETQCSLCGRLLRVGDEHAGKQARCPECGQISVIPLGGTAGPRRLPGESSPAGGLWSLRTPEGKVYGPIARTELDQWVAEGRITADCDLFDGAGQSWMAADALYPQIRPAPVAAAPRPIYPPSQAPPGGPTVRYRPSTGYLAPHRGGAVLVLGILGFMMGCPIFSFMAWVMGSADLREMRAGRMDRSGEGLTQIGHILGAVVSLLWIGGCVILALIMILAAAAGR